MATSSGKPQRKVTIELDEDVAYYIRDYFHAELSSLETEEAQLRKKKMSGIADLKDKRWHQVCDLFRRYCRTGMDPMRALKKKEQDDNSATSG